MSNLSKFLELKELLKSYNPSAQDLREFGLKNKNLSSSFEIISKWLEENRFRVKNYKKIVRFEQLLKSADLIGVAIALILGAITAGGLLSYSGKEPVNILYFLFFVFFLPLISGLITLYSIFTATKESEVRTFFTTFIWNKIFSFLQKRQNLDLLEFKIPKEILNLKIVLFSIKFSLSFYIGFALSFLIMVIGEDIAFGWRSTLKITVDEFYSLIKLIAAPWWFLDGAIPSKELIQSSHYYRLGGGVDPNLIKNVSLLGEWWKFLFMSVLVYGIFFRILLLVFTKIKLNTLWKEKILSLEGVQEKLFKIKTPLISTQTKKEEQPLTYESLPDLEELKETQTKDEEILNAIGWSFKEVELEPALEVLGIKVKNIYEAGGAKSLEEDMELIDKINEKTWLFIKSWEAPTMDFFDFVEDLLSKEVEVIIYPIGLESQNFIAKEEDIKIWQDKLLSLGIKLKIKEPKNG